MNGVVKSVNVSGPKTVVSGAKTITTGIFKTPVTGKVAIRGINVEGDDQADRAVHGGPVRAVYAYAQEDYDWWEGSLGHALPPGKFGENLTLFGIDVSGARIGERWRVGSAVLQVTSPRVPCYKLALAMDDPHFIRTFARALRPGAYLSIEQAGDVRQGDVAEVLSRPDHPLTVAEMARIYLFEHERIRDMLVAPELPDNWRTWVLEQTGA